MFRTMLKSKIHRAAVTRCDLHYVGSLTIDAELMDADAPAGHHLLPGDTVRIMRIDPDGC